MKKESGIAMAAAGLAAAAWLGRRRRAGYHFRAKRVFITGGSRGLGLVMARELVREGATVTLAARDRGELERARQDLLREGGPVYVSECDVTIGGQVEEAVHRAINEMGGLDVLINNAGIIQVGPFDETTLEDFDVAMKTHFWAPLHAIRSALPTFRRQGGGRVINISSFGGKVAVPHMLPYVASKFALTGLSEGLTAELAQDGVVVTTVCPGLMRTGSTTRALFKGKHQDEYAWFALGGATPVLSMSAEKAARRILEASRRGQRELLLGWTAKTAAKAHGLFPEMTERYLELVSRLMPEPGGIGKQQREGRDSRSAKAPWFATVLQERAAARNNEVADRDKGAA